MSDEYRFNGVKGGLSWKGKTERHFIARCPILKGILEWAEQEELETISPQRFQEAVGGALTREQVHLVNAAIWGFLSGSVSGPAEEIFKRADTLNGLDAWRRMTRYIDHGREIRRETLRREVKMLHTKPIRSLEAVEMGVAEFENTMAEYHRAGGTRSSDQEMKDDLLHILPAELRDALVWNSRDSGSFHTFRDMVTTQAAKVLMNRHKLPVHHVGSGVARAGAKAKAWARHLKATTHGVASALTAVKNTQTVSAPSQLWHSPTGNASTAANRAMSLETARPEKASRRALSPQRSQSTP